MLAKFKSSEAATIIGTSATKLAALLVTVVRLALVWVRSFVGVIVVVAVVLVLQ